ncbi:MAG: hypothetical protein HY890_06845 [Deltaproteobacteria bacterium]|nr:hypothetical protein [Deltaproteobacteria bacterium]
MIFFVLIAVLLNGIVSFAYVAAAAGEPTTPWAMLAVNFVFYLGITQTGIVFSAMMRLTRSEWGRYFSRLGEVITLSFMPVAAIVFFIIYFFGAEHLFYWANPHQPGGHISPWVGRGLFFWRNIISNALFYITGYLYFSSGRREKKGTHPSGDMTKRRNILAVAVCFFYVAANTMLAWDFGMMIIPHWESSIFPPYYWVGNLLGGTAFLFVMAVAFISKPRGERMDGELLDSMGKVFIGFVLLWVYMFWSQHIALWYANLPHLSEPVFRQMRGNYAPAFIFMLLTIFIIPFLALLLRPIKLSANAMAAVSILICIGVWINRYLMIIPVFTDAGVPVITNWTNISLIFGGLSSTILSLKIFSRLFPEDKTFGKE